MLKKTKKVDTSICTCQCHEEGVFMMHIVACCYICEDCGENISTMHSKNHENICIKKNENEG